METFSKNNYFTEFVGGLFLYFEMFGSSLFVPCSFVTEYVLENFQFCDSEILSLASGYGHLEIVKFFLKIQELILLLEKIIL